MNLPYITVVLNGLDNITSYLLSSRADMYEINPIQRHFIEKIGVFQFQIIEFMVFTIFFIFISYLFHKKSKIGYYTMNGVVLICLLVAVINNILLMTVT